MTYPLNDLSDDIEAASAPVGPVTIRARRGIYRRGLKRVFDVAAVVAGSVVVVPLVIVLAAVVMLDGGNPFYASERVGKGGRTFRMLKLRTMVNDADARLEGYLAANPAAREEWDSKQKLKHDPRVTRLGTFLRKSSLDELPQLWNVLTGDMSLVGPRPMMPDQRAMYPGLAYYALRPGLTGLWQVSDRNKVGFAKRADFDTEYERILSLQTDLVILFRTVGTVASGTGY